MNNTKDKFLFHFMKDSNEERHRKLSQNEKSIQIQMTKWELSGVTWTWTWQLKYYFFVAKIFEKWKLVSVSLSNEKFPFSSLIVPVDGYGEVSSPFRCYPIMFQENGNNLLLYPSLQLLLFFQKSRKIQSYWNKNEEETFCWSTLRKRLFEAENGFNFM